MYNSTHRNHSARRSKTSLRVSYFYLVFICLALTACTANVPVEPTGPAATQTPTEQPRPSPSSTPSVDLSISKTHWLGSPEMGEGMLIGTITNLESFPVGDVLISLHQKGSKTSEELFLTSSPIPAQIQPSMEALFYFTFPYNSAPTDLTLSYIANRADSDPPTDVQVEVLDQRETSEGRLLIRGEVKNQGDHLLRLQSVHILLLDEQGETLGIAVSEHLLPALPPNGHNPFIASADAYLEADSWKAYVNASPALMPPIPPFEFGTGLKTEATTQGQPYFLGEVENQGVTPWWMVLNVLYLMEDEVLGLDTLELPFPIPPRDRIPFVLDPSRSLPPDILIEGDPGDIEIQMVVDPWKALPSIDSQITIPISITQFEQIGSKLYLQGVVTNTQATPVSDTAAFITVYDVQGRTRAVGWSEPLGDLRAGDTKSFRVNLLIPKELDLTLTEFDVRAFGFPSE